MKDTVDSGASGAKQPLPSDNQSQELADGPFTFRRLICAEIDLIVAARKKSDPTRGWPTRDLERKLPPLKPKVFPKKLSERVEDAKEQLTSWWRGIALGMSAPPDRAAPVVSSQDAEEPCQSKPWDEKQPSQFDKDLFDYELTALCLSGGGIRSATFCLGVIQALAKSGLLSKFDYLSTVSGGGYIGSWLTAWVSRGNGDTSDIELYLGKDPGQGKPANVEEPAEIQNLRAFSNYLTPRAGILSLATWTGVTTVGRNIILNWLLFLPLFLLIVSIPKLLAIILVLMIASQTFHIPCLSGALCTIRSVWRVSSISWLSSWSASSFARSCSPSVAP